MILKYIFDRLVSLIGLLILSPILIIVAILIKVKMPGGPVLFVQERVGRYGRLFKVHKFRSMTVRKETDTVTGVAAAETARITPLGEKLRKYKIDELPELWDVLTGKMSFVGPRPDIPGYADLLKGDDREILKLRPGITGPASLKYRNEEDILASVDNPQQYKLYHPEPKQLASQDYYCFYLLNNLRYRLLLYKPQNQ